MTDPTQIPPAPADKSDKSAKLPPFWWPDTRSFLAMWMSISSFIIIVLVWWKPPGADNQLLNTLIGLYVGSGLITVINWWVGSSKSSDDKNAPLIASAMPKGP